jgi:uncharacterized protein (TIGR02246 family)
MKSSSIIRTVFALLALVGMASAQDKQPTEAEKTAKTLDDAYVAAFGKGDVKVLATLYAEDAQYTNDSGTTIAGRAAIAEGLTKFFAKNKGAKLEVQVESARFLAPEVLLEKGVTSIGENSSRYICNYIKKDGSWLISELIETALPPADRATTALGELSWLVGSWKDNAAGTTVSTTVDWTKNRHFLRRSVSVTRADGDTVEATEIIGYDPVAGGIRSWVFDSEGGFGEGTWVRDVNKWLVAFKATGPDGTTSSAQHVLTYVDDNKYTWESINRQREGEALPNLDKIEVVRATAR